MGSFIKNKDDIKYLGGMKRLLEGTLPKDLQTKLDEIIAYRNQLAHGETAGQATELTLDETVEILEAILCRVG